MEDSSRPEQDITGLLKAWKNGDQKALERLVPLVDGHLRKIARQRRVGRPREAVHQTTSMVDEIYLRLIQIGQCDWRDRAHFFALCARIIRGILIDRARARQRKKRGGGASVLPLDEALAAGPERTRDLMAIDDALTALAQMDPRRGRVVELRFFGGMSVEEIAEVLGVSAVTVRRDWQVAKMWLFRQLHGMGEDASAEMATGQ